MIRLRQSSKGIKSETQTLGEQSALVCYISRSNISGDIGAIEELRQICVRKNAAAGVNGALYYDNDVFFQALEGEQSVIQDLLAKISSDSRHRDLQVLSTEFDWRPQFQKWSMKFVSGITSPPREKGTFSYNLLREAEPSILNERLQALAAA